jgi:hypothetical protein
LRFDEIQVGQRFRIKGDSHENLKGSVWVKTEHTPPLETVKFQCQSSNALYVEGPHTGKRAFFCFTFENTGGKQVFKPTYDFELLP